MKKLLVFDAGHADRSDQPGTVQGELHLPAPVPAVFLHGRFAQRGNCAVMAAPTFVENHDAQRTVVFMPVLYEGQAGCSQGIQTPGKPLV